MKYNQQKFEISREQTKKNIQSRVRGCYYLTVIDEDGNKGNILDFQPPDKGDNQEINLW